MQKDSRFVGLDVHAETVAVAVAECGGAVRALGVIPNRAEAIRRLVKRLGPVQRLIQCDNGTEFTSRTLDHWAWTNKVLSCTTFRANAVRLQLQLAYNLANFLPPWPCRTRSSGGRSQACGRSW
jgi:hypothetical protein